MNRLLALLVIVLGVVCLGVGAYFIQQGISKNNYIVTNLKQEKITTGLSASQISAGQIVDNAASVQAASEKVRSDRRGIAPTYNDLLNGGRFDPTNTKQLSYAQALNLENSLNLALLGLGVVQIAEAVGAFMIVVAVALFAIGVVLWRIARRNEMTI